MQSRRSSTVHNRAHGHQTMAKVARVPYQALPLLQIFVYKIRVHKKVRKGEGGPGFLYSTGAASASLHDHSSKSLSHSSQLSHSYQEYPSNGFLFPVSRQRGAIFILRTSLLHIKYCTSTILIKHRKSKFNHYIYNINRQKVANCHVQPFGMI